MTKRFNELGPEGSQLLLAQTAIRDLMVTVTAMREQLELMTLDKETSIQEAVSSINDEVRQLKATAVALREELEILQIDKEESIQYTERTFRDENNQLQEAVAALRTQLEELHASK